MTVGPDTPYMGKDVAVHVPRVRQSAGAAAVEAGFGVELDASWLSTSS